MARPFAAGFYNSRAWKQCRKAYFESKFGLCENCGGVGTEVHHIEHLNSSNIHDPKITLGWDNLRLLCHECHRKEHGGLGTADGLKFDKFGNLIER